MSRNLTSRYFRDLLSAAVEVEICGRLLVSAIVITGAVFAQSLSPATPSREYIRLNGQAIAIENNAGSVGPPGYGYSRVLTINGASLTADLTNFPVLFSATVPSLATVANGGHVQNANGYDILFTADAGGTQKLNWEIESYDPASGAIVCWIQIPQLTHAVSTNIYLSYGNPNITADQSNRAGTWDSTFTAVYHFGAGGLFLNDSTGNANNGAASGPVPVAAQIASGAGFPNNGYISVPDAPLIDSNAGTWEFWFKDDTPYTNNSSAPPPKKFSLSPKFVQGCATILTKADTHDSDNGIGFATCNGALFVQVKSDTAGTQTQNYYTTSGWHHSAFTFSSGATYAYYSDGAAIDSGTLIPFTVSSANPLRMGQSLNPAWGDLYQGSLDEVRLSTAVRSAGWIATEYANQSNPANFVTVGAEAAHP